MRGPVGAQVKSKSALEQAAVEMRAKLQYLDNAQVVAKSLENAEVRRSRARTIEIEVAKVWCTHPFLVLASASGLALSRRRAMESRLRCAWSGKTSFRRSACGKS